MKKLSLIFLTLGLFASGAKADYIVDFCYENRASEFTECIAAQKDFKNGVSHLGILMLSVKDGSDKYDDCFDNLPKGYGAVYLCVKAHIEKQLEASE